MTSAFSRAGRSGGSQALQLPRASNSCGSSAFRLHSACAQQKSENSVPVLRSPIRGEVWRAPSPPAPSNIKFLRKFRIPPPFRLRPAEVGKFRSRLAFTNSGRGLEGARPVCFISRKTHRNNRSYCNKNFHQIQLGKINAVKRHNGDNPLHF